ncbi:hypothetical protein H8B02_31165 [Bradyrhizobium sp. Pear77]|uniref:hypothetical protein n=2 Tax=Bradyrhizobium TaxID=374 RepID=UPI001E363D99|nr:hypothetical protein [Bradyrhizobium altum]MCC8957732.1 hypothetical protein [Bradyrhizobium altum]
MARIDETREVELAKRNARAMTMTQTDNDPDRIDRKTCRYICDAVGERLQQSMRPEPALSSRLQQLLDEMQRQETGRH